MQRLLQEIRRFFAHDQDHPLQDHKMPPDSQLPAALNRPFRALVFDWDGTAVENRHVDATELCQLSEEAVDQHIWMVVVTGTNFGNIDRQFTSHVAPERRHHIIVCANRGSEVYGFDGEGQTVRRWLRVATPAENRALDAVAEGVAARLREQSHLEVNIVYNRLNRRKIDLIPLPEWADPPKAQIGELLKAVNQRLSDAHVDGGIHGVIALTQQLAAEQHLDARITSDVKNIEVGLTDKADAILWIKRELLQPEGIPWHDVLIEGDELGPIAGFPGSDDRLRVGVGDALVVSVGPEPNGVPKGVLHVGGGPARFRAILAQQIALHRQLRRDLAEPDNARQMRHEAVVAALSTSPDPDWSLSVSGAGAPNEAAVESELAIGNGYLGARGSMEIPSAYSNPRYLVAGLFAPLNKETPIPALVSAPDWARLRLYANGTLLVPAEHARVTRTLDLRRGLLYAEWQLNAPDGPTLTLRSLRGVSLANRALAWHLARFDVDQPAQISVESWLEPLDVNLLPQLSGTFLQVGQAADSPHWLAIASSARLDEPDKALTPTLLQKRSYRRWEWAASPERPAIYYRIVAAARDDNGNSPGQLALDALCRARCTDLGLLFDAHVRAWEHRWQASDVVVEGDALAQRALRFAIYELIAAADPDDSHVSVGARSLTGDAYHGHVFWDTEIFLLPFYTLTWPAAAGALLLYRYHTLPAARAKAASLGYRGALYAWESADTGAEATPAAIIAPNGETVPVLNGRYEHHISADIAYAAWRYWDATEDAGFLLDAGAEIILETARFWDSRATLESDGRYHIRDVIGPDEYHEHVDDNAFTNNMACWNLSCGCEVAEMLAERWPERWQELRAQLALSDDEIAHWRDVAQRLVTGFDEATGIIEQFDGFSRLAPLDVAQYARRTLPIDLVIGHERTQQSQVVKQADVVMLLALLWGQFDDQTRRANFAYYAERTAHDSSLSPPMHALVAARLGDATLAARYFRQAVSIDTEDTNRNEAGGIHIAAQAGLWQATIFGFAGLHFGDDGVHLDPHLPEGWSSLRFPLRWRSRALLIAIEREPLTVTITLEGHDLDIHLGDLLVHLSQSHPSRFRWDQGQSWVEGS
jgi:trehalose/maltose hydrolase-like predicted phosphorylase